MPQLLSRLSCLSQSAVTALCGFWAEDAFRASREFLSGIKQSFIIESEVFSSWCSWCWVGKWLCLELVWSPLCSSVHMELLGQQQSPRAVELWKKLQTHTPQFQAGKDCRVDCRGCSCKIHPQSWRQLQGLGNCSEGRDSCCAHSRVLHVSHHINYCWTQVNLYLLNMQCLGVGSLVSRSFLGRLFVWSVVNVFIFLLLCMWSGCLCLLLFSQLDHVQPMGNACTGNSGLQHLLD